MILLKARLHLRTFVLRAVTVWVRKKAQERAPKGEDGAGGGWCGPAKSAKSCTEPQSF